jgi:hypothetical protein
MAYRWRRRVAVSMNLELGYTPADTAGEQYIQRINAWEAPRLPGLDHSNMRRWATSATWVPPDSQILVRHRSLDGNRRVVTNDRHPPPGFVIEYDLGVVHSFAQPGTKRLVASNNGYFCTPFEGILDDDFEGLGYIEEAALPMLDVLEVRREPESGEQVLVAGADDPLYNTAVPLAIVGFIEGYPVKPRHTPHNKIDWGITILLRDADPSSWRHRYSLGEKTTPESVALGGLWTRPANKLAALYMRSDGRLYSELLNGTPAVSPKLSAKLHWAAAPLNWPEGRPRSWAMRAAASRARMLAVEGPKKNVLPSPHLADILLGYVRRYPSPGWSPLFSATHPALVDQYLTRSELEAMDMGYRVDGVLGYVIDRGADRSYGSLPKEVKWASRFGQRRRYVEGFRP